MQKRPSTDVRTVSERGTSHSQRQACCKFLTLPSAVCHERHVSIFVCHERPLCFFTATSDMQNCWKYADERRCRTPHVVNNSLVTDKLNSAPTPCHLKAPDLHQTSRIGTSGTRLEQPLQIIPCCV